MPDLFEKRSATSFGSNFAGEVAPQTLEGLHQNDPLSQQFQHPVRNNRDLLRYLTALQVQRYGRSVDLPPMVMAGHAKLYAKQYTLDALARGICYASRVCENPFSLAFVANKILPQLREKCPFLILMKETRPSAKTSRKRRSG